MGTLRRSSVEAIEQIELSLGIVSGVGLGIRVLEIRFRLPGGLGFFQFHWFEWRIFIGNLFYSCVKS